jgi:hypothetical protein
MSQILTLPLLLLTFFMVSCTSLRNQELSMIWREKRGGPEEMVRVAQKLVPLGSTMDRAELILGEGGTRVYRKGATALVYNNGKDHTIVKTLPDHGFWSLEYPLSGGYISLTFSLQNSSNYVLQNIGFLRNIGDE